MEDLDFEVKEKNLYEVVADHMEDMILSNPLRQGERLPSEQELALKFGISHSIMKESLKPSKEWQLIVQKNGEGAFIARPESGSATETPNRVLHLDDIGYTDIYKMRKLLGPYASRVVAEKRDDLDFEKLEQYLQGMIEGKDIWDMRIGYDIQSHACMVEATGNPLLTCFIKSMMGSWKTTLFRGIVKQQEGHQDGTELRERIIKSLKKGDSGKAEAIMRAHVEKSAKMYWVEDMR